MKRVLEKIQKTKFVKSLKKVNTKALALCLVAFFMVAAPAVVTVQAQTVEDATSALTSVSSKMTNIWEAAWKVVLGAAALVGVMGAIVCMTKWQQGDPNVTKHIFGWFGSVVVLILMGFILKSVFVK